MVDSYISSDSPHPMPERHLLGDSESHDKVRAELTALHANLVEAQITGCNDWFAGVVSNTSVVDVLTNMYDHDRQTFLHLLGHLAIVCYMMQHNSYLSNLAQERPELAAQAYFGSLLHDIGKLAIDSAILNKEGGLSPDEWKQMTQHPKKGHELIAKALPDSPVSALLALGHHSLQEGNRAYPAPEQLLTKLNEAVPEDERSKFFMLLVAIVCADQVDARLNPNHHKYNKPKRLPDPEDVIAQTLQMVKHSHEIHGLGLDVIESIISSVRQAIGAGVIDIQPSQRA